MPEQRQGLSRILARRIETLEHEARILGQNLGSERLSEIEALKQALQQELAMKRIIVFGTDHDRQEEGRDANAGLEQQLVYLIREFAVTIVMEEWSDRRDRSFVDTRCGGNWELPYKNVGTPSSDGQFQTIIPPQVRHPGHDGTLLADEGAPALTEYGPLDKQENREVRMVENIKNQMLDHRVGLLIVGLGHLHSISRKLQDAGFNVASYY
jgi:hypothetical protein